MLSVAPQANSKAWLASSAWAFHAGTRHLTPCLPHITHMPCAAHTYSVPVIRARFCARRSPEAIEQHFMGGGTDESMTRTVALLKSLSQQVRRLAYALLGLACHKHAVCCMHERAAA